MRLWGPEHDANLAEYMEDADLESLASELITDFESDKQSRRDWARSYTRGLDLLGMKIEERTQPWQGAAGVFTPSSQKRLCFPSTGNGRAIPRLWSCAYQDCWP